MTDFERVLQLFVNGAIGIKTDIDMAGDIENILKIAYEHNIYFSIVSALFMSEEATAAFEEEEPSARRELKNVQLKNYVRMFTLSGIFARFEEAGIPYALLKGHTVGMLYKDPYSRVSGDVDLLINPRDEKRARKILCENGFVERAARTKEEKHGIYRHPIIGMLELHISLFNKKTSDIWFNAADGHFDVEAGELSFETLEKIEIEDMHFYTLEINKRVEYLFLHNVKHFILGGSSIRAIMDFYLTYTSCRGIDYEAFYEKIRCMGLEVFFRAMLTTVARFCEINEEKLPFFEKCDDELVDFFLYDMEKGSWFGYGNEGKTEDSWKSFEEQKREESGTRKSSRIGSVLKHIFPPVGRLKRNYPYSKKCAILLPVAWLHRAIRIAFGKVSVPEKAKLESREVERIELLKKMAIMK